MQIDGMVHCFFEQSGTFKKEFQKLGYKAEDYDIQNEYGETDHVMDLFAEIETAYSGGASVFDKITKDDLIVAFFPCIYFECLSMMAFNWGYRNYRKLDNAQKTQEILKRAKNRYEFYTILLKFIWVVETKHIRMIFENPYSMQHYFKQGNFVKHPDVLDNNRMLRGDYFVKPTGYWFFGCEPTYGESYQNDKKQKRIHDVAPNGKPGVCNAERSMISPDYARNWICDFVLGKKQDFGQMDLF